MPEEGIYTMALLVSILLAIMVETVIIMRIVSGFIVMANQVNLLKALGNVACALAVTSYSTNSSFEVVLPSEKLEFNFAEFLDVSYAPGVLSIFSYTRNMGIPQYMPLSLREVGNETYRSDAGVGGIVARVVKRPLISLQNRGGEVEVSAE